MKTRQCKRCSLEFVPVSRGQFCGDECRRSQKIEKDQIWYAKRVRKTDVVITRFDNELRDHNILRESIGLQPVDRLP